MTSVATWIVSRAIFPLQETLKRHSTLRVRRAMDESQWWPVDRLSALQDDRLRRLVKLAAANVPYYQDVFAKLDGGFGAIRNAKDLTRLPLLSKEIIRTQGDRMKSVTARDLARFNTGGSSGEPLIFFIGRERVSHDVAAKWRATRWWGVDIGDRELVVWGSPIEVGAQDRLRGLRDRVMRTELLPAFEMSEPRLDEYVARICERQPHMMFGYPSAISLIAAHAERRGVVLSSIGVKVVFVTSERLYDHQRNLIERVFGCRVANGYGGRDAGFIAHECPAGSMHITAEDMIVEVLDSQGLSVPVGETGEIVVTHLATPDFPFIRYRTGDIGALASHACVCGRGLPVLEKIEGRSTDFVMTSNGSLMHGLSLIYILRDLAGVKAFKVVQESRGRTVAQLVTDESFDQKSIGLVVDGFKRRLGEDVEVVVDLVSEIPPEKSGKFRYIVSHAT